MAVKTKNLFEGFDLVADAGIKKGPKAAVNPVEGRRLKVIDAIAVQKKIFRDPNFRIKKPQMGEAEEGMKRRKAVGFIEKQPRRWFESLDGQTYVCELRYGNKQIDIQPGLKFARVPREKVEAFYDRCIELIEQGEYDTAFAEAAKRPGRGG